jgi:AmiR/NasT family two-component response regulator
MAGTQSERSTTMLQAEAMVSKQAECRIDEALEFMADRAAVQGITIEEVAQAVVDHSIRFGLDAH